MSKEKILEFLDKLERTYDFNDAFFQGYTGRDDSFDISDYDSGNFDDAVELGFNAGQLYAAEEIFSELRKFMEK